MDDLRFKKDRYAFISVPAMVVVGDEAESIKNKQITMFLNELNTYNVLLKDLVDAPIKESDRNISLNIAHYIMSNEELSERIIEKRDLPISKVSKLTKLKPEYLEKCKDYIIAYYVILNNPNYKFLQDYLKIKLKDDDNILSIQNKKEKTHKGLVLKLFGKCAYIITPKGEFFKIRTNDKVDIGQIVEGREKRFFGNYKIHISIFLVIVILIGSGIVVQYRTIQSIVVIETTSNIKLHINKFNKVIYAYSPTDKGKELLKNISPENKDVDDAISKILEYAYENKMIDLSKKTLVTINGQPLKYGLLAKTDKLVSENNIPIMINNSGNQQSIPKQSSEDKTKK
ncbi:anti-sigma factor domain-containing protein [Clostridium sp.]|uniref:anti-sigma factor domain-containing protein n=1 Tax=Clostridium sp. TaxID=1506 RepID=UPI002843576F|nr:anti-sigma factor domain-containing protein [Clostridium sp.]MDR3596986.1 anti-sigma factor domain-containing protein [Clostridium sp.]